jgi:hypothetical protein
MKITITCIKAFLFNYFARGSIIATVVLFVAGCSTYAYLPEQNVDGDYKVFSVIENKSGVYNIFVVKLFESDGKVAMCGGYTRGESSFSTQGARNWADISKIKVGDTVVGNADFMDEMPVYGFRDSAEFESFISRLLETAPATNCVRSDVAWQPEFETMEIERTGPNSIRVFD